MQNDCPNFNVFREIRGGEGRNRTADAEIFSLSSGFLNYFKINIL